MPCVHAESCFNCFGSVSSLWRFVAQSQIPVMLWNRNNICDTGTNSRWMAGSTDQQLNFTSAFNCLQKLFIAWCTPSRQHYLLNKHVVPGWQGRGTYQVSRNKYGRTPSCIWDPPGGHPLDWLFWSLCHQRWRRPFQPQLGCGHMAEEVIPSFWSFFGAQSEVSQDTVARLWLCTSLECIQLLDKHASRFHHVLGIYHWPKWTEMQKVGLGGRLLSPGTWEGGWGSSKCPGFETETQAGRKSESDLGLGAQRTAPLVGITGMRPVRALGNAAPVDCAACALLFSILYEQPVGALVFTLPPLFMSVVRSSLLARTAKKWLLARVHSCSASTSVP